MDYIEKQVNQIPGKLMRQLSKHAAGIPLLLESVSLVQERWKIEHTLQGSHGRDRAGISLPMSLGCKALVAGH